MIHKEKSLFVSVLFLVFLGAFYFVVAFEGHRIKQIKTEKDSLINTSNYEATGCDSITIAKAMQSDSILAENARIKANWNELKRRLARKEKYGEAPYRVIDTTKE